MRCDAESAYLHQFDIYLGRARKTPNGLGYDVVMKLCQDLIGKKHHVYFDNLFSSAPLMMDLLELGTYSCGTVRANKRNIPDAVKQPGKMLRGAHKCFQYGNTNLVATVWMDNKHVRMLSTNSSPRVILQGTFALGDDDKVDLRRLSRFCSHWAMAIFYHSGDVFLCFAPYSVLEKNMCFCFASRRYVSSFLRHKLLSRAGKIMNNYSKRVQLS